MINIIKFVIDQSNKKIVLKSVVSLFVITCLIGLLSFCIKNLFSEENLLFTTSEYLEETPVTITWEDRPFWEAGNTDSWFCGFHRIHEGTSSCTS